MVKEIHLHYSEMLIRNAVKAFWIRVTGWRFFVALSLVFFSLVYFVWSGDRSWWVGVMASAVVMGALLAATIYIVHFRSSLTKFRQMRTPEATFEIGDERFRMTSDIGSTELSWRIVTEIWQFQEFWLLLFSRAQFVTLPLADLDTIIVEQATSHGAKVS